jgi:hypothetical protein
MLNLPTSFTLFSNEQTAIKEAMTYVLQANDSVFFIFTDSKSLVVAIQDPLTAKMIVQEIQMLRTETHSNQKDVSVVWVPPRQGIQGNGHADRMDEEAAGLPTHGADVPTPHSDVVAHTKGKLREDWHALWDSSATSSLHSMRKDCKQNPAMSYQKTTSHYHTSQNRPL